jgi:hypothetical protein
VNPARILEIGLAFITVAMVEDEVCHGFNPLLE